MREFRDGTVWCSSSSGFRLEQQLFESVRDRRPKPSNWKPGADSVASIAEDDLLPPPDPALKTQDSRFERFALPAANEQAEGVAARFRAIGAVGNGSQAAEAADRLDDALRRLKSERP
jgi:hypothetical protein